MSTKINDQKMPKSKKTVCDLCSDTLGKGQDILTCEGTCSCTVHRYCAGVTTGHFQALNASSTPFVCQWCMLKTANAMIQQLQSEVASLKSELVEVRAEVLKKDEVNSTLVSSLKSELATVKDQLSRNQNAVTASYASAVTATRPPNAHPRSRPRSNRTTPRTTKQEGQEQARRTNQNRKGGKAKVKVTGARKIWGTLKACSHTTILSTISKLLPSGSKLNFTIKRKTRELGTKIIWWFIVHGSESDLSVLENEWERIELQTSWKLEPCFMPVESIVCDTVNPPQEASPDVTSTPSGSSIASTSETCATTSSQPPKSDALPGDGNFLEETTPATQTH